MTFSILHLPHQSPRIFVSVVGQRRVLDPPLRLFLAPEAEVVPVDADERLRQDHLPHEIRVALLQLGGRSEIGLQRERDGLSIIIKQCNN